MLQQTWNGKKRAYRRAENICREKFGDFPFFAIRAFNFANPMPRALRGSGRLTILWYYDNGITTCTVTSEVPPRSSSLPWDFFCRATTRPTASSRPFVTFDTTRNSDLSFLPVDSLILHHKAAVKCLAVFGSVFSNSSSFHWCVDVIGSALFESSLADARFTQSSTAFLSLRVKYPDSLFGLQAEDCFLK